MARINRLQHLVLNVRNAEESIKFYTDVLGMEVVSHNTERKMAFLSFGTEHHDIALFEYADAAEASGSQLLLRPIQPHVGEDQLGLERCLEELGGAVHRCG